MENKMELFEVGIRYEGMVAMFSTRDKAEAYVAKMNDEYDSYYIDTVILDEWA